MNEKEMFEKWFNKYEDSFKHIPPEKQDCEDAWFARAEMSKKQEAIYKEALERIYEKRDAIKIPYITIVCEEAFKKADAVN